jgi:hypothetical protein
MSLTSYRAAPPRGWVCVRAGVVCGTRLVWCVVVWCVAWPCVRGWYARMVVCGLGGPGGGRLSRGLSRSIMGAGGFHGRVRDGIGWGTSRHGHQVGQARPALFAGVRAWPGSGRYAAWCVSGVVCRRVCWCVEVCPALGRVLALGGGLGERSGD